jgi:hypothetical protein
MIDKKMLLEDLKFPLRFDGYSYIWDKDGHMVAMFVDNADKEFCNEILTAINTYADNLDRPMKEEQKVSFKHGEFKDKIGNVFLITRGWGRLQYKSEPEKRQDNMHLILINNDKMPYIPLYAFRERKSTGK